MCRDVEGEVRGWFGVLCVEEAGVCVDIQRVDEMGGMVLIGKSKWRYFEAMLANGGESSSPP